MADEFHSARNTDTSFASGVRDFVPYPYQLLDETGRILAVNAAWLELVGYERDSIVGEWFGDFLTADSTEQFESAFADLKIAGRVSDLELEMRHADGHTIVISMDGRAEYDVDGVEYDVDGVEHDVDGVEHDVDGVEHDVDGVEHDADGQIRRAHCQLRDITEQKKREWELELYEAIVEESTDVATIIDTDGVIRYVSPSVRRIFGYEPEELIGENGFEYQPPDDRKKVAEAIEWVRENPDQSTSVDLRFRHADGTWRWIEASIRNYLDDDVIDGILVNTREIDDRKQQEQELKRLTQEYKALFHNTDDAIFLVDVVDTGDDIEFQFERLSRTHQLTTGLQTDDVRGKRPRDVFDSEVASEIVANYHRCVRAREPITYEETLPMPEGDIVWQTSLAPVIVDDDVTRLVGIARDVTEDKKRERELERYERLVENLPVGVYQSTSGPEGEFTLVNDAMVELFDAESKTHLMDHTIRDFYADTPDRDTQIDITNHPSDSHAVDDRELKFETLTGETIWGAVTAVGREVGGTSIFEVAIQDITERKAYEQRLEDQRDSLDVLNQVLRHDIRNDLQIVTGYAELLSERVDEQHREYVETLQDNAEHAVELTTTARDIADVMLTTVDDRQRVLLSNVLEDEVDRARSAHPEALITVEGAIPSKTVFANDMLCSVFRNLLNNAIRHNDKAVTEVTVSTTSHDDFVQITIADNGPGIPDDQKQAVFGKGQKGLDSEGTGMGLHLVQTLVDTYGGDVWIADNDPEGSVFTVELPTVERE